MKTLYTLVICAGFVSGTALAETIQLRRRQGGRTAAGLEKRGHRDWQREVERRAGQFRAK